MSITAPTEPRRDAKAGYCARCRNGQHLLCASPPIAKAYPEFEFKAVKIAEAGQSSLYGRWLGRQPESGPTGGGGEPTAASGSAASIVARAPSSSRGPVSSEEE